MDGIQTLTLDVLQQEIGFVAAGSGIRRVFSRNQLNFLDLTIAASVDRELDKAVACTKNASGIDQDTGSVVGLPDQLFGIRCIIGSGLAAFRSEQRSDADRYLAHR